MSARQLDEVLNTLDLPGDGQVDRKRIVLPPGRWAQFDPFLMMAEDWFTQPGFDWHPHRGMETVTFVLAGRQRHADSTGGAMVLEPGDAQWMTAGSGLIHQELAEGDDQVHSLQLWVNLPRAHKLTAPRIQHLQRAGLLRQSVEGGQVTVYAGEGVGTKLHSPLSFLDLELEPGGHAALPFEPRWRNIIYVLEGSVEIEGRALKAGQVGLSHPSGGEVLTLRAQVKSRALIFSGLPLSEPVAQRGPFVMNTAAELDQAMRDYRAGRLAPLPR